MALEARRLAIAENSPEQIQEHLKITNGIIRTRFPPEPNGYLHVGHAKSINMNFQGAFEKLSVPKQNRFTYLRFDDTNPEAEKIEYIESIVHDVASLGWTPDAVTYSSEYFSQMYDMAVQLIRQGDAYVCHQSKAEIEQCRNILKQRTALGQDKASHLPSGASPFRNRSVTENLIEFERMRRGEYEEKQASLRLKFDLTSPNPNLWDPVAYRVKFVAHPHIGNEWCVYPTYDYTHCIVDSLEHIDYSICTLEFETRRESYYMLLDKLNLYKPKVYEFARLNLTNTVLSKRKLKYLVESNHVSGWDDPRMPTLSGLRRCGFTGQILNAFCNEIGVTRVDSTVQIEKLHATTRSVLADSAKRAMAVFDPIKVTLVNYTGGYTTVSAPDLPQRGPDPSHSVVFGRILYIDSSDFRMDDSADYFGLAPNKEVGLKYAYHITCTDVVHDPKTGKVVELYATVDLEKKNKPKGHISWVAFKDNQVKHCHVRVFDSLFLKQELEDDWKEHLNPNSQVTYLTAMVDMSAQAIRDAGTALQFERSGYYVLDPDSTEDGQVWNRTVALREATAIKSSSTTDATRKAVQEKQMQDKAAKLRLDPKLMFIDQKDQYAAFDQDGIPTHDVNHEPLSKSLYKKLKKEWQKQAKLFEKHN